MPRAAAFKQTRQHAEFHESIWLFLLKPPSYGSLVVVGDEKKILLAGWSRTYYSLVHCSNIVVKIIIRLKLGGSLHQPIFFPGCCLETITRTLH
jgi:hypothetical protein